MARIRTVLGGIAPEDAGMAGYHIKTMVDMTACEVGRHPRLIAEVARRSGLQILAITGFFPSGSGSPTTGRSRTSVTSGITS